MEAVKWRQRSGGSVEWVEWRQRGMEAVGEVGGVEAAWSGCSMEWVKWMKRVEWRQWSGWSRVKTTRSGLSETQSKRARPTV